MSSSSVRRTCVGLCVLAWLFGAFVAAGDAGDVRRGDFGAVPAVQFPDVPVPDLPQAPTGFETGKIEPAAAAEPAAVAPATAAFVAPAIDSGGDERSPSAAIVDVAAPALGPAAVNSLPPSGTDGAYRMPLGQSDAVPVGSPPPPAAMPAEPKPAVASPALSGGAIPARPGLSREALRAALDVFVRGEPAGLARYRLASPVLRKGREAIAAFYKMRDDAPLWVADGQWTAAARNVIERISTAADDGLDLSAYPVPASPGQTEAALARAELALSEAVAAYGFQASGGRIEPTQITKLIGERPATADAMHVLVDVAIAADPAAVLAAYNPPQPEYAALRLKLAEIRRAQPQVARTRIPYGPPLKVGMRDPRVSLIRARFGLDVAPADPASDDLVYDTVVATAVADFQRANGLPASGVLTRRTIVALSGGDPSALENEIVANMERWRWMPREMGSDRIEVDIPDFKLRVFRADTLIHEARVIVGKPTTPTPIFSNAMQYLTVNPSWYVPQSIIKNEMLPKLADDPDYLTRQGYVVTEIGGQISVRQPPGERNALGHIVFQFPNQYAVYLHDTPTRGLFGSPRRAFSHGCVRVDQPFKLAEIVLNGSSGWTEDRVRAMIGRGERSLYLPQPMPIHIEYFTAFVDDAGKLQVRDDLYGLSKRVQEALGLGG